MAGTLTATHQLNLPLVWAAALVGSLIADTVWYIFGQRYGSAVVRMMCRLSLESSACVRKTEGLLYPARARRRFWWRSSFLGWARWRLRSPGRSAWAFGKFLLFDAGGVLLWAVTVTLGGYFFGDILRQQPGRAFLDAAFLRAAVRAAVSRLPGVENAAAARLSALGADGAP